MRRWQKIPEDLARRAAEMLATHSSYDVAAALGIDRETVNRNARRLGVKIRPRGQPALGVKTYYMTKEKPWPIRPKGVRPISWAEQHMQENTA